MNTQDAQKAAKPFAEALKKALKEYCDANLADKPLDWSPYKKEETSYEDVKGKTKKVKLAHCVFTAPHVFFQNNPKKVLQGDALYMFVTATKGSLFSKPVLLEIRVVYGIDFYPDDYFTGDSRLKSDIAKTIEFAKSNGYEFGQLSIAAVPEYLSFFKYRTGKHMCLYYLLGENMTMDFPDAKRKWSKYVTPEKGLEAFKNKTCEGIVKNLKTISANIGSTFMKYLK